MAASSEDKDCFHIIQKNVFDEFPQYDAEFFKAGGFPIESSVDISTDKDYTEVFDSCIGDIVKYSYPYETKNAISYYLDDIFVIHYEGELEDGMVT